MKQEQETTNNCELRFRFYTREQINGKKPRPVMCCHARWGMFLKDMRCVGRDNSVCPKVSGDFNLQTEKEQKKYESKYPKP